MEQATLSATDRAAILALHGRIRDRVAALRRDQAALGRDLEKMNRCAGFLFLGVTSFGIYCEHKAGLAAFEGFQLVAAAEAFTTAPGLEERVADGRVSLPSAAAVGKVLRDPGLVRPGDDWLGWAERESTRDLRDRVKKREAEKGAGGALFPLKAWLTAKGVDDFVRAKEITIRSTRRALSEGETIEIVVHDHLGRHDPERRAARLAARDDAAPAAPTVTDRPETRPSRHVPEAVKRAVVRAQGDRCRVDRCDRRSFLQDAHLRPFREGGPNTAENLLRLCPEHHRQLDAGAWRLVDRRRGTYLVDRRGIVVGRLRPPPGRGNQGEVGEASAASPIPSK